MASRLPRFFSARCPRGGGVASGRGGCGLAAPGDSRRRVRSARRGGAAMSERVLFRRGTGQVLSLIHI